MRVIGKYNNWIDALYDARKEGVDTFQKRVLPARYFYDDVPKGYITAYQVEEKFFMDEIDARIVVSKAGGKEFKEGLKAVSAAPLRKVKEKVKEYRQAMQNEHEYHSRAYIAELFGISERTICRACHELGVKAPLMERDQYYVKAIHQDDVKYIIHYLLENNPYYWKARIGKFKNNCIRLLQENKNETLHW